MSSEIMKNLMISVIAGLITAPISLFIEYTFFANRKKLFPELANQPELNSDPKEEAPQPKAPFRNVISKAVKFFLTSRLLLGMTVATITFFTGYWSGSYRINGNEIRLEIPTIIQELAVISDPAELKAKLDEYKKRGILAVGQKDDFEDPDGVFVFVFDERHVYKTFLFQNRNFFDLRNDARFVDLPKQFRDKSKAWVIETHKLVRPN